MHFKAIKSRIGLNLKILFFKIYSRSPTMAGGLFMIERNYFYEFGAYDEGMDIWGAENIELSLRVINCSI